MADLWFSTLTRSLLRRGEFTSRADLADKITGFAIRYNQDRQALDLGLRRPRRPRAVPRPPQPPAPHPSHRRAGCRSNPPTGRLTATATIKPNPSGTSAGLH
jgi:hypothetical protein